MAFAEGSVQNLERTHAAGKNQVANENGRDLVHGFHEGIDVAARAEKDLVRKPNRLAIGRFLRLRTAVHGLQIKRLRPSSAQRREVGRIEREQRTAINRLIEKTVARYPFRLQSRHKCCSGNLVHFL
jgi:hypothetical protein